MLYFRSYINLYLIMLFTFNLLKDRLKVMIYWYHNLAHTWYLASVVLAEWSINILIPTQPVNLGNTTTAGTDASVYYHLKYYWMN